MRAILIFFLGLVENSPHAHESNGENYSSAWPESSFIYTHVYIQ